MSIQTIKDELRAHLIERVQDGVIDEGNFQDAHHYAFNEDYYIIGYYQAEQWLKEHNVSAFEAIDICITYERDNFGEVNKDYDDAETTVNMLTYVLGQDVTPYANTWAEFLSKLDLEDDDGDFVGCCDISINSLEDEGYQYVSDDGRTAITLRNEDGDLERFEYREYGHASRGIDCKIGSLEFCHSL